MWFNDDEYDETSSANTSSGSPTPTTPNGATNSPASNSGSPLAQQLTPRPEQLQQNGVLGGASAGVVQTNLNDELKDSSAEVMPTAGEDLADAVCGGANGGDANGADKDEDARSQSPGSAAKKVWPVVRTGKIVLGLFSSSFFISQLPGLGRLRCRQRRRGRGVQQVQRKLRGCQGG